MVQSFIQLAPHIQALIATLFTWGITALGAGVVFFFRTVSKTVLDALLGFAAGVMMSASFFSLLSPSIEMGQALGMTPWIISTLGFFCGALLLFGGDHLFSFLYRRSEGKLKDQRKRCIMLFFSITLHNIPEGMVVGVAFGSLAYALEGATLSAAILLALGIGIQNFPEGMAVSVALRREGLSRTRSFFYGQLSGIVEPISGFAAAILVGYVQNWLPFFLAFAAGAMIYVVVQELIPESQSNEKKDMMSLFTLIGFSVMMVLDLALG